MLNKICENCQSPTDCMDHSICILLLIANASGGEDIEYSEVTEYTDYTEEANITDTLLPHIDDNDRDAEDYIAEGF